MKQLSVDAAIACLREGGVIAYPTEAVWGLGCDPGREDAVMRLLEIKRRPVEKGVIVVADALDAITGWADFSSLPPDRQQAVTATWPGPNTWILPPGPKAPTWITGSHHGIAVRISAHPLVRELCRAWGAPLVSTSANLAGEPPARRRDELTTALLDTIDGLIDGQTGTLSQPTQIRDARSGQVLRV